LRLKDDKVKSEKKEKEKEKEESCMKTKKWNMSEYETDKRGLELENTTGKYENTTPPRP